MNPRKRMLSPLVIVLGVCYFFFFFGLGAFGLVGADEPRYAQIGREMLARHDWITPTLNGVPWLEKPVLLYWGEMLAYKLFGVHDWAARLPSATMATGLVVAIFFFMRRFRPGRELLAALMAASLVGMIGFGRGASTDMQLSAPFCVAMLCWWAWHETGRKIFLSFFYALLGLGMLAKGPVAPGLAVLVVAAYAGLRRNGKIFLRSIWWPGILLFCAIALPWYVALQMRVPSFFKVFFLEHNLERFSTNLYQHTQPFWYYIPVFLLATIPWVIFVVAGMVEAVCNSIVLVQHREEQQNEQGNSSWLSAFLLVWIAVPVVFFSISRSKLPGYILPGIPPVVLLAADYLYSGKKVLSRFKVLLHALICGLLVGGALFAPWRMLKEPVPGAVRLEITLAGAATAVAVLLILRRKGVQVLHAVTLVPMILALGFLLRPAAGVIDEVSSARTVDSRLNKLGARGLPMAVLDVKREVEYGLNFYRNQPILRYERDGVPAGEHVVVANPGSEAAIQALVAPRQLKELGEFAPQHLEFFRVSNIK